MDIRVLNYFLVTAGEKNITKAAELLHLTQPTLSRQLKSLEAELGVDLFIRAHHRIELTSDGILFQQRARDIVHLASKAQDELTQNQEVAGEISIGCSELQSMEELATIMGSFQKSHPLVNFALHSGNNNDIKTWIEQGVIDMGLLIEPVDSGQYESIKLHQAEEWGVLVHEESAFSKHSAIRPGDLVGTQVITILDTTVRQKLAEWSGEYAAQMVNWARYNLIYNAAMLAQQNQGVVLCLKLNQQFNNLKFIPLEPQLTLHSIIAWHGNRPRSKAVAAFIETLQAHS